MSHTQPVNPSQPKLGSSKRALTYLSTPGWPWLGTTRGQGIGLPSYANGTFAVELSAVQRQGLEAIFEDGICDYSAGAIGAVPVGGTWQRYSGPTRRGDHRRGLFGVEVLGKRVPGTGLGRGIGAGVGRRFGFGIDGFGLGVSIRIGGQPLTGRRQQHLAGQRRRGSGGWQRGFPLGQLGIPDRRGPLGLALAGDRLPRWG